MSDLAPRRSRVRGTSWLYPGAIFTSAALVFLVQPMIARMVLPQLGGSPAVWNVSMAFFQFALLTGYAYAHLLQRLRAPRAQATVHVGVLVVAAAFLPLGLSGAFGPPPAEAPALWLLAVLAASVGAPFAVLSATAPLLQAWYARASGEGSDPYVLYAASNLGSLLGLAAYPLLVEPLAGLETQARLWTGGYVAFAVMALILGFGLPRAPPAAEATSIIRSPLTWRERLTWVALSAIPSGLLLGVTSHITTDVASAPFLWVAPLALYLLTFVNAFAARPLISREQALFGHAVLAPVALITLLARGGDWAVLLPAHLGAFFLSALVCHQALAARRPPPDRLTEFYLLLSLGGVVGGAFTAFVAPVMFDLVWEYPAALVLIGLARPGTAGRISRKDTTLLAAGLGGLALAAALAAGVPGDGARKMARYAMIPAVLAVVLLRERRLIFTGFLGLLAMAALAPRAGAETAERGFFGVHTVTRQANPVTGGAIRVLYHGTTLHGAQRLVGPERCRPMTYYAPGTPLHEAVAAAQARRPAVRIGVSGRGTGSLAAYTRPGDRLRFFEIDPLVLSFAGDRFSFVSDCARGAVDTVLGDARLTLAREPEASFDLLVMDAFSSDSVPSHLLTREAMRLQLRKLKPDGMLAVHVSNRHLALAGPVAAALRAEGAGVLVRRHRPPSVAEPLRASASDVVIAARDPAVLAGFRARGWEAPPAEGAAWRDDYVNLVGALWEGARR